MRTRLTPVLLLLASTAVAQDPPLPTGAVKRLGDTRFRPGVRVSLLAFSPDGSQVASVGNWLYFEDRLSVWDAATGRELFTQPLPEGMVTSLGWGPDGGLALKTGGSLWAFADAAGKFPPAEPGPKAPAAGRMVARPAGAPQAPAGPPCPPTAPGWPPWRPAAGRLSCSPPGPGRP